MTVEASSEPHAKLQISNVSKTFHSGAMVTLALDHVSIDIATGEFVCFVGPSGCGKTTLLNIMAGLEQADYGLALFEGSPIQGPGRERLVMFQESALFPWLTVIGNVLFGLNLKPELSRPQRREIALEHLRLVGLEKNVRSNTHELSGGMKQRVALARSLAPDPQVLLMDEPFAALDAMTREQLYGDLQDIWQRKKKTIIFVTHNVREAACLADRVVLFSAHPGRIRQIVPVDLPRPRDINDPRVAEIASQLTRELKSLAKS